jgi:hypothetical protein
MKKFVFILVFFISVNIFAGDVVSPEAYYNAVLTTDIQSLQTMLAQEPDKVSLDAKRTTVALIHIRLRWCRRNSDVSLETIKHVTKLLSDNLSYEEKVEFMNGTLAWSNANSSSKLIEMGKVVASQINVTALADLLPNFLDKGLVSKTQLIQDLKDLVSKAKTEENRSQAVDMLSKAGFINNFFFSFYVKTFFTPQDKEEAKKISESIVEAEKAQNQKDKELLKNRINEIKLAYKVFPLSSTATDEDYFKAMARSLLESQVLIEDAPEEDALAEIIVGTPEREFGDSLIKQLKGLGDAEKEACGVLTLLFMLNNGDILYRGESEDATSLLMSIETSLNTKYGLDVVKEALLEGLPVYKQGGVNIKTFGINVGIPSTSIIEKAEGLERVMKQKGALGL